MENTCDRRDSLFALAAFGLGFLFVRWVLLYWRGYGVSAFTLLYAVTSWRYLRRPNQRLTGEHAFWLACLTLTGLSFALWPGAGLSPWRELFLFAAAVYWVVLIGGLTLKEVTSDWLPLDFLQGLIALPFRNFTAHVKSVSRLWRWGRPDLRNHLPTLLGAAISLLALIIVVPLLLVADSGGFARLITALLSPLRSLPRLDTFIMLQLALAVPTAAYIFGLLFGARHRRGIRSYTEEEAATALSRFRLLPDLSARILLGLLSIVYTSFMLSQMPYFFSAFVGERPPGYEIYAVYARSGFFELCAVAIINLGVLAATALFTPSGAGTRMLKALRGTISALTLVLIATAASKMALYIAVYGLSMRRLLPLIFMAFLATLCMAVIVRQRKRFSLVRFAALLGALIMTVISLANLDTMVVNYNVHRFYVSGTLNRLDMSVYHSAGPAGVDAALRVLESLPGTPMAYQMELYLRSQYARAVGVAGTSQDTLQWALLRHRLSKAGY